MQQLNRRQALAACAGLVASQAFSPRIASANRNQGRRHDFSSIHELMERFIAQHKIAGATLGIYYEGEMMIGRGYGLANVETRKPVEPETLFSLASCTKSITGVGILKLVDEGRLDINAPVMGILKALHPLPGHQIVDPRFHKITVKDLLFHGGGLPHDAKSPSKREPQNKAEDEADERLQYRWLLSHRLDFDPGTQHAYSNAGFVVLRLVIEYVTGEAYEPFIRKQILAPMGIEHMRMEAHGHYKPDESHRYEPGGHHPAVRNVANWLASGRELARFAAAVGGSGGRTFLSPQTTALMLALPPTLKNQNAKEHVGLGWDSVERFPSGYRFSKNGGKPGVQAWLEHMEYGVDWALMFNTGAPKEPPKPMPEIRKLMYERFHEILGLGR